MSCPFKPEILNPKQIQSHFRRRHKLSVQIGPGLIHPTIMGDKPAGKQPGGVVNRRSRFVPHAKPTSKVVTRRRA